MRLELVALFAVTLSACPAPELDAGAEVDAGVLVDAGALDAGLVDAGLVDAGPVDAGRLDAGRDEDAGLPDASEGIDAGDDDDAGSLDAGESEDAGAFGDGGPRDAGNLDDAGPRDAGDVSTVPAAWTCSRDWYDDGACDCGCGVFDPACSSPAASACGFVWCGEDDRLGGEASVDDNASCVVSACWVMSPSTEWPGSATVDVVDSPASDLVTNTSGLVFEPPAFGQPARVWAVRNAPSRLHRLVFSSASGEWTDDTLGWPVARLRYPDGTGNPDAEGVTLGASGDAAVFIASERDGTGDSKLSVLRYDVANHDDNLVATEEWDLTADLASVGVSVTANGGLEAITYVPDTHLLESGFVVDTTGALYDPLAAPAHHGGIFVVGVEETGQLFAYLLHLDGGITRLGELPAGLPEVMSLEYHRETRTLWVGCDNNCGNQLSVLTLEDDVGSEQYGHFRNRGIVLPPAELADANHEGIAVGSAADGTRDFFWCDDSGTTPGVLLRSTIPRADVCSE